MDLSPRNPPKTSLPQAAAPAQSQLPDLGISGLRPAKKRRTEVAAKSEAGATIGDDDEDYDDEIVYDADHDEEQRRGAAVTY